MAEFAMVVVLLMMLFLAVLQVCLWLYARNLLIAAGADVAARMARHGPVGTDIAVAVTAELGGGPAGSTANSLRCLGFTENGMIAISCTMATPGLVGLLDGALPDISVTAHATAEGR